MVNNFTEHFLMLHVKSYFSLVLCRCTNIRDKHIISARPDGKLTTLNMDIKKWKDAFKLP